MNKGKILWNNKVKLILSDVDETIVDLYQPANKSMIDELTQLLRDGINLFLITGQSLASVQWRIIDKIPQQLRTHLMIAECSGSQVWGFDQDGNIKKTPYYSLYEKVLTPDKRAKWREIINNLINEFHLELHPTMPVAEFKKLTNNPNAIMYEDRGSQITFEFVNGYSLSEDLITDVNKIQKDAHVNVDVRILVAKRAKKLFQKNCVPINPRLAGVFALDFVIAGVNKTTAVQYVLQNEPILNSLGLTRNELHNPEYIEIWGDKFSIRNGGTDRHICEAVSKKVRAIDFRDENPEEFLDGYNIRVWDGKYHLHLGLLEYLQDRRN